MPENKIIDLAAHEMAQYVSKLWNDHQLSTMEYRRRLIDWYKQYRGIPGRKNYDGLANVFINETLEATESIVAQIFSTIFSEPKPLKVFGREETDEIQAKLIENVEIYYLEEMNYQSKILRFVRQMVKYGTGVARVCWCLEGKQATYREKVGGQVLLREEENKITRNCPDLQYVDLLDVAFDPGKSSVEDMNWIIVRKRVDWDYIKQRERQSVYSSEQVKKIDKNSSRNAEYLNSKDQRFGSMGINYSYFSNNYEILELWGKVPRWWIDEKVDVESDAASDMVEAVIEVVNESVVLRAIKNPYWHGDKPFLISHYIQVDDEAYGIGTCEISEYLQMELNDKRNQLLDHATFQIFPPLLRNRASNIKKDQIQMRPHKIIDSDLPGDQGLTPLKIGGNPIENVTIDGVIKQDIRNSTGATNPVQGIGSNKDTTAYEVSVLERRGSSRINVATIDLSNKFLKPFYKKVYQLIQQYVPKKMIIRIVGKDGVRWQDVTPDDLILDADFIPNVPTDLESRTIVRNQMIQFVQSIGQLYPRINIAKIARKVYELFGFNDVDEVVPEPDTERGQNDLTIEEEIQVLSLGQMIDVKWFDNHLVKMSGLIQFLSENERNMTPKVVEAFKNKIMQHQKYLEVLQQAQSAALGGAPAPAPAPAGHVPRKSLTPETQVSSASDNFRVLSSV